MRRRFMPLLLCVAGVLLSHGATATAVSASPTPLVSDAQLDAASAYARARGGAVSFAVVDAPGGRPRGRNRYVDYPSASVSKAMLMVAVLRRAAARPLSGHERALLKPMIAFSDNDAAATIYAAVGPAAMSSVARLARMQRFRETGYWAGERITAADQARLFYRIDGLVPRRHRQYARDLLSGVTRSQRWGIARIAEQRGYKVFFKGGWRSGVNHQVALLEKDGRRLAIAILTNHSDARGRRTQEGIAARLLD
ncbi:MAG TPA: serine hydrolase [Baekduia sp.]|nr:serine hydrolase [Baekduia sp.]